MTEFWSRAYVLCLKAGAIASFLFGLNLILLFFVAPFVPDEAERQLATPIPLTGGVFLICAGSGIASGRFRRRAIAQARREAIKEFERGEPLSIPPCFMCQYYSGESLLPCAVHPTMQPVDCPDFEVVGKDD